MPVNKFQTETRPAAGASASAVEEALRVLAAAPAEDFDGHTEFQRLTPAERLAWMDGALELIESRRRGNGPPVPSGRVPIEGAVRARRATVG